ncbi:MAG TPA: pilus assembly protein N-terminal domain-containing protein [Bryobacteraceae bacterium]|nr:pilus assembly protein N-terminal domain-containing protein [Bryobacteraceae bacterium]
MSSPKCRRRAALAAALVFAAAPWAAAQSSSDEIRVTLGKSIVIDYPEDVSRISTSNPEVADYVPVSSREILLHAKGLGAATLVVWAKSGQRNFYNISVEQNLEPIRKLIKDTFPSEDIRLQAARDSITISGLVSSVAVADRVNELMKPLAKSVINNVAIRPLPVEKQILLRVKFAEINRNISKQFGFNLISTGAGNTPGAISTGQFSGASTSSLSGTIGGSTSGTTSDFSLTDALNIFAFRPDLNLAATIKLLQQQGMLQILAEPNLVTTNGKEASFLVGGEFPVPVLQGGSNSGAITIQFREYGIRLTFTPRITENGTLKMHVKPEVSTIDVSNGVTVSGFTIPALATRRIESDIELGQGQSFVIGGLIDDRTNETFSRIPGLSSIPLLGELFKSRNENRTKSELLVMVTPELVEPMSVNDPRLRLSVVHDKMQPALLPNGIPGSTASKSELPALKIDRSAIADKPASKSKR